MALLASLRSTIAYQTTGSTISTGAIYTTLAGNIPTWTNQLTYSTLTGTTISTNSIAAASTLTGSSIILGGNLTGVNTYMSGNVGIGITSPGSFLQIQCTSATLQSNAPDNSNQSHGLLFISTKSGSTPYSMALGVDFTTGCGYINGAGNSTYQPIVLQSRGGNVGIGTTNPSQILEVYRNSGVGTIAQMNITSWAGTFTTTNQSILNLRIQGAGGGSVDNTIIGQYYGSGGGTYGFSFNPNNGTNVMNILGNGNVGIGTTNPGVTLDVNGSIAIRGSNNLLFQNGSSNNIFATTYDGYTPGSLNNNLIIRSWYGIAFASYDSSVRVTIDTRTGNANFSGTITAGGITAGDGLPVSYSSPFVNGWYIKNPTTRVITIYGTAVSSDGSYVYLALWDYTGITTIAYPFISQNFVSTIYRIDNINFVGTPANANSVRLDSNPGVAQKYGMTFIIKANY